MSKMIRYCGEFEDYDWQCPRCHGDRWVWEDDVYFAENPDLYCNESVYTIFHKDCDYCCGLGVVKTKNGE